MKIKKEENRKFIKRKSLTLYTIQIILYKKEEEIFYFLFLIKRVLCKVKGNKK